MEDRLTAEVMFGRFLKNKNKVNNPPKILFKYPSRGRPDRFFDGMDSIYNNLNDKENFGVLATFDIDDKEGMANKEVFNRLHDRYKNFTWVYGVSNSKIHAINRDMDNLAHIFPFMQDFDILINASDDMRFNIYGFDDMVRVDAMNWFPNMDGLLHYPDQDAKEYLATMYIAGRKWWEFRNKNIYHPSYKSLWCDNEEMAVAQMMGKYKFCGYQINIHLNPAYGHLPKDEMFNIQQGHWQEDEANFNERKARNFDLDLIDL